MSILIAQQVAKAFQACDVWTLTTPGDAANGTTSTTWTPVTAEIARVAPASAPRADRLAAHTQIVFELRRARDSIPTSRKLGPAERLAFGNFVQLLLNSHEAQLAAI